MKHNVGDIWTDSKEETYIKDKTGKAKTYYRYIVEDYLGFSIPEGYTIHHLDFNHNNNRLDNLMIVKTCLHVWIHRTSGTKDLFVSNIEKIKNDPDIVLEG